ncbi:MAG: 8-amino-7-oxononanoate synthase [Deltaproteobacteria bacterium]|nr:8-amino-7-oxononanoate synthase [Deltaproteobacteria bacterium]
MDTFIKEELEKIAGAGLKRNLTLVETPQGPRVSINGQEKILLCSNDYLGLSNHPAVKKAMKEAIDDYGAGAGASRLVSGNMAPHHALEERIKRFKDAPAAILFNSGYNANIGVITTLAGRDTGIFSDKLNHASIVDACVLSRANVKRYPPRNADALEALLKKSTAKKRLIITEGVFSMDGTIAPLEDIIAIAKRYGAAILLDDAHSIGVLGKTGRGTLEHFSIRHAPVIELGTLGKAFGVFGAFVTGSRELIELLVSKARPLIYTTALPPSVCAGAIAAIDTADNNPLLRERLWENVSYMREGLEKAGLDTMESEAHIIPLFVGRADRAMEISKRLLDKGVFIQGIRPPTVPEGGSRLRITVTAAHTKDDIDFALSAIKEAFNG